MFAWVFRHRHQLRALYGLPPEPAFAALLAAVEEYGDEPEVTSEDPDAPRPSPGRRSEPTAPRTTRRVRGRLPVVEVIPAAPLD